LDYYYKKSEHITPLSLIASEI